jgi:hypothetical protein
MDGKAQKSHGARSGLYDGCSDGVPPISVIASIATFQSRNADAPLRLLRHPKKGSFKTVVTPFSRSGWKSHGARSGLYCRCSNGVPPIHFFQTEYKIQFRSRCGFWAFRTM